MTATAGTDIRRASSLLRAGDLVAIPTETVYGLAANALDDQAVVKIFKAKDRPRFNPLIVHLPGLDQISRYASDIPEAATRLATAFWPGPLTLLLPKKPVIPDLVTAGSPRVALRVPDHPLTLELLANLDFPLAAPSANPFGYISPTTADHVLNQLGEKIQYVLDGGACRVGLESTIVGFENGSVYVHRLGGISLEALQEKVGQVQVTLPERGKPQSSGQLKSHYAPVTYLELGNLDELLKLHRDKNAGVIAFDRYQPGLAKEDQFLLAPDGKLDTAARRLFQALHDMDGQGYDVILAQAVPDMGLGRAINDRLRRARGSQK